MDKDKGGFKGKFKFKCKEKGMGVPAKMTPR